MAGNWLMLKKVWNRLLRQLLQPPRARVAAKTLELYKARLLNNWLFKILCCVCDAFRLKIAFLWKSFDSISRTEKWSWVPFWSTMFIYQDKLSDKEWLFKVGYLVDLHQVNVFIREEIFAFKTKVQFWISYMNLRDLEWFQLWGKICFCKKRANA